MLWWNLLSNETQLPALRSNLGMAPPEPYSLVLSPPTRLDTDEQEAMDYVLGGARDISTNQSRLTEDEQEAMTSVVGRPTKTRQPVMPPPEEYFKQVNKYNPRPTTDIWENIVAGFEGTIADTMYESEERQRTAVTQRMKDALRAGYTPTQVLDTVVKSDKYSEKWRENLKSARKDFDDIDVMSSIIKNYPAKEQTKPQGVFPGLARTGAGLFGDWWSMVLGYAAGVKMVTPIANVVPHPLAKLAITQAGGVAGALGLPKTIKAMLDRKIEEGNVNIKEVHKRAWDIAKDSAKEYVLGGIMGVTGVAMGAAGLSPLTKWAAESTAFTYGQGAIEGRWPTMEDWTITALTFATVKTLAPAAKLMQKRYEARRNAMPDEEPIDTYKKVLEETAEENGEKFDPVTGRFIATDQGPGRRIKQPKTKKPAEGVGIDTELEYEEPTKEPTPAVSGEAYYEGNVPIEIERELRAARTAEARDEILTRYKNQMGVDVEEGTGGTVERPIGPTAEQQPGMYTATDMAGMALGELQRRSRGGPDVAVATELPYEKGKKAEVEPSALAGEVGEMADPAALYEIAKGSVQSAKEMDGIFLAAGIDPFMGWSKIKQYYKSAASQLYNLQKEERMPASVLAQRLQTWAQKNTSLADELKSMNTIATLEALGKRKITKEEFIGLTDLNPESIGVEINVKGTDPNMRDFNEDYPGYTQNMIVKVKEGSNLDLRLGQAYIENISKILEKAGLLDIPLRNDKVITFRSLIDTAKKENGGILKGTKLNRPAKYAFANQHRGRLSESDMKRLTDLLKWRQELLDGSHMGEPGTIAYVRFKYANDSSGSKGQLNENQQSDINRVAVKRKEGETEKIRQGTYNDQNVILIDSPLADAMPFRKSWNEFLFKHMLARWLSDPTARWMGWYTSEVMGSRWGRAANVVYDDAARFARKYFEKYGIKYERDKVSAIDWEKIPQRRRYEISSNLDSWILIKYDLLKEAAEKEYVAGGKEVNYPDLMEEARKQAERAAYIEERQKIYYDRMMARGFIGDPKISEKIDNIAWQKAMDDYEKTGGFQRTYKEIHKFSATEEQKNRLFEDGATFFSGVDPTKIGDLIRRGYRAVTRIDGKVYEEGKVPSTALVAGQKIENGYMGEKGQFIPQEIAEKSSTPTFFSGVDITNPPFKKGPSLIKAFVDEAIKSGRFVPYYNRSQGKAIPRRQQSGISDKEPDKPKRDIYRLETYQSPNQTFSRIFDINSNPVLDVFPAMMAAAKNTLNMKRWASNVLDKIPDSTKEVIGTMKPIFDKYREVVETFNKNQDAIEFAKKGLRQSKGNVEKMREYQQQIAEAEKELAKLDRPLATMGKEADAAIAKLAEQYSDVRVYLHAARELPPGIKLTPTELDASNRIHQYMRETGAELHKAGIPTLDIEKYMPRIYRALLNDKTGKNVFNTSVPAVMRFMSRCPSDRSWIPSAHAMTKAYIPMSEFKLAYQPFLNRWGKFINTLQEPELKAYMNRWVYENLYRKTDTLMNKAVNAFTMMEYIRIIGGSLSVALKHLSKQVGTWAYFGLTPTVKAEMSMAKVPIQAYMKWKGVKGDYPELHAFQMYNNLQQFIRALDEVPGLEIKHRAMAQLQLLAGNPTIAAEMLDNGVSVMAGIMMGAKKGMTFNQTYRALWDVILNTNFRASWDQPLFQKAAGVRALTMFQMTPYKLFEYKTKLIENAIQNKKDAFGNSEVARLLRYALTVGGITYAARQEGVDVLEWFTHPPFVKDLFKQVKEEPYLVAGGADLSEAPVAQMAHEMKVKGILGGAKTHFKDWGMITKIAKAVRGEYNTEMYKRPEDFILGLRQIESKYIEGAMEKRQELQELRREQDKKIEPLVDKYIMTKDTKYIEKIREFVAPLPKEQQDRIFQHCDNYAKTVGLPDRKWWTTLMSISPEERAELFHKRYKETPQKDRAALELNAMNLDGFATQRFRARIKELGNP